MAARNLAQYSFIGVGSFWIRNKTASEDHFIEIGNVNEATFSADEDKLELRDYTSPGGGNANTLSRLQTPVLNLTISNLSPLMLSTGLRGTKTTKAAGAKTDEAHTAYLGTGENGFVRLDFVPDTTQTITVTGSGGTPTYTAGTDYTVSSTGIIILNGGAITDSTAIEVDYTALGSTIVEALTSSANEYEIILDGVNEAKSNAAVAVTFHSISLPGEDIVRQARCRGRR